MNCSQTQEKLPLLLYGDLDDSDAILVETHLAECEACEIAFKELSRVRELLDAVPAEGVPLDMGRIPGAVSPAISQPSWSWREYALWAALAVLLVAVLFNTEVRFERHQLIVRWGNAPIQEQGETIAPRVSEPMPPGNVSQFDSREFEERLGVLDDLVHALAGQVNSHDQEQRDRITALQTRLRLLEQQSREYRDQANRSVAALYAACFPNDTPGEIQ